MQADRVRDAWHGGCLASIAMNVSLHQAAAAMTANARWQEVISENLSASFVPGFKKQDLSFQAVQAGLPSGLGSGLGGTARKFAMPSASVSTNFQNGEMKPTGGALDVAIEGPGFFEIQLPNGDHAYTRDGEFELNSQGQLVTKQGLPVASDSGVLQFDVNNPAPISISPSGEVSQGGDRKGTLRLMDFGDERRLTPLGGGMFANRDPQLQPTAAKATLRQRYLEAGYTSGVSEMTSLITSLRMYEANQKVVQSQDERMGRAIADLGTAS